MTTRSPDIPSVRSWVGDAVKAPSMHNAQPWRFRYMPDPGVLQLRMDPTRVMPRTDPAARGLHVGCGAALFNLRVAAAHAGWECEIGLLPDSAEPELLANASFVRSDGADLVSGLYPAVDRRRTSREPFSDEAVPEVIRDGLSGAALAEGARLAFLGDWQVQNALDLVWDAEREEALSPSAREEIARWTDAGAHETTEGIPSYAFGPRRHGSRVPVRDFGTVSPVAGRQSAMFEQSPCLAVLGTRQDRQRDWLLAGQAMQRVLLQATRDGLSTSLNSQALEWPELRWVLRDPLSAIGVPQMLIRLGYGPATPATPRRPVSAVLDITPSEHS